MFPNKVPKNARNLAVYKADKINELGIEIYKDDRKIAEYLREECPNTEIVIVSSF